MLKKVTLSADEELIAQARDRAERQGSTLNAEFRQWLQAYAQQEQAAVFLPPKAPHAPREPEIPRGRQAGQILP